jgi:NADH-quinone oxidoreductase subunit K
LERKNENQLGAVSYEPQARSAPLRAQSFLNMPVNYYIFVALALFCIGVIGVLTRRNAIIVFMCIELMLNAVNLLLVAFSKMHYAINLARNLSVGTEGQLFVFFIMVVAAAEVSVGLAIIVMMYRNTHSTDINFLNRLKH